MARQLHGRSLTVITSNLAVYEELQDDRDVQLLLLGGVVRRDYRSLVGFLTEDNLRQVHADRLFLGTSGVRPDGQVLDTTAVEVPVKRAMIAASAQVVLVADAGKFPGTGMARVCGPEELDVVVTNAPGDEKTCSRLREAGVEVVEVSRLTILGGGASASRWSTGRRWATAAKDASPTCTVSRPGAGGGRASSSVTICARAGTEPVHGESPRSRGSPWACSPCRAWGEAAGEHDRCPASAFTGSPGHRVTGSPGHRVTGSPERPCLVGLVERHPLLDGRAVGRRAAAGRRDPAWTA